MPHLCTFNTTDAALRSYSPAVSLRHTNNLVGARCLWWSQLLRGPFGRIRRSLTLPGIVETACFLVEDVETAPDSAVVSGEDHQEGG